MMVSLGWGGDDAEFLFSPGCRDAVCPHPLPLLLSPLGRLSSHPRQGRFFLPKRKSLQFLSASEETTPAAARFSEVKLRCVGYWKGIPWQPASLGHLGLERHKDRNPGLLCFIISLSCIYIAFSIQTFCLACRNVLEPTDSSARSDDLSRGIDVSISRPDRPDIDDDDPCVPA